MESSVNNKPPEEPQSPVTPNKAPRYFYLALHQRRIVRPESLHHSKLPHRGKKNSPISVTRSRPNAFSDPVSPPSRQSSHSSSWSTDYNKSLGTASHSPSPSRPRPGDVSLGTAVRSPSRRSVIDTIGSVLSSPTPTRSSSGGSSSSESTANWVNHDGYYTSRPLAQPARGSSRADTVNPNHIPRRKETFPDLTGSMATTTPNQNPTPPQSVQGDSVKVQIVASDPREPQPIDGSKESSFIHVGQAKTLAQNPEEFPAPAEVYNNVDKKDGAEDNEKKTGGEKNTIQIPSVSYASALKGTADSQDDDDSYPDLDEMNMDMVHQPPKPKGNGGIRWVPFNVPLKRRGQTLAVLMHSLCIVITVSFFCACCANPFVWPLLLIYLLHVLNDKSATDGSLRYRSERFRRSYIWKLFAGYFPAQLHVTHNLPPTRKYIFGYHPHGIISHGAWAAFATEALGFAEKLPGIKNTLLTLESNFRVPFYRDYLLFMGMRSVSRESIVNILTKGGLDGEGMGRGVTIVVGGARESLEAMPGNLRLILKERKGFIKIAIRTGSDLVPVLAFGENSLYDQLEPGSHPMVHKIQMFILKVWKFTLPFMHGRGIFNYDVGMMPYRHPLNIVVGAPIKVTRSSVIDSAEVDRLHELYVTELEKLWDRYKDEFAKDRKEEMQILA